MFDNTDYYIRQWLTPVDSVVRVGFDCFWGLFYTWNVVPIMLVMTIVIVSFCYVSVWLFDRFASNYPS